MALGTMAQVAQNIEKHSNDYTFSDKLKTDDLDHITHV